MVFEGQLVPDYHYIEVKPDSPDLIERLDYYSAYPTEAESIVRHAHEWVNQFRDRRRESLSRCSSCAATSAAWRRLAKRHDASRRQRQSCRWLFTHRSNSEIADNVMNKDIKNIIFDLGGVLVGARMRHVASTPAG